MKRMFMTGGQMPSKKDFYAHYKANIDGGIDGGYEYHLKGDAARVAKAVGYAPKGEFDVDVLFDFVTALVEEEGDDEAQSLASSILQTLGIEWV